MLSIIKKNFLIQSESQKLLMRYSRPMKKLYLRYFFYHWNKHAEYRAGHNLTKSYLLLKNLWYFQKKNFLLTSVNFKYKTISICNDEIYIKLQSKLIDFNKKIFKKNSKLSA